jgi:hypothetical protein
VNGDFPICSSKNLFAWTPARASSGMNEYEFPAHRHGHDFKKIDELFAREQDFPSMPELTI